MDILNINSHNCEVSDMSFNYGLSSSDIEKAKYKIKCNKAYMRDHGIMLDDKIIPFSDFVTNSYINSDRYIAELQHRAWSVYEYAKKRDLQNIFFTLTLPSKWHKYKTYKGRLIKNKKFGGRYVITNIKHPLTGLKLKLLNSKENIDKYKPRNASKELSKLLKRFFNERSYRSILKENRIYFRVTEPHKSGTPHLHISLFVPSDCVDGIVKSINRLYPSPQSKIELEVNHPVKYLLKYVLKTLDDLRDDVNKITALSLWYIFHGISRFYTSRTFVSLDIYRKLKGEYSLVDLTESYDNEELSVYFDTQTGDIHSIENRFGTLYIHKPILGSFSNHQCRDDMELDDKTYFEYEFDPIKTLKKKPCIDYYESKDGKRYIINNGLLTEIKKQPYQMNYLELYRYFNNIDIDTVDDKHYIYTRNLMIDKGLIVGERLKLTAIEDLQTELEGYGVFNYAI
jgi:hypothetical protein